MSKDKKLKEDRTRAEKFYDWAVGTDYRTNQQKQDDLLREIKEREADVEASKEGKKARKPFLASLPAKLLAGYITIGASIVVGLAIFGGPALALAAFTAIVSIGAIIGTGAILYTGFSKASQAIIDSSSPEQQQKKDLAQLRKLQAEQRQEDDISKEKQTRIDNLKSASTAISDLISSLNASNLAKTMLNINSAISAKPDVFRLSDAQKALLKTLESLNKVSKQDRTTSGLAALVKPKDKNEKRSDIEKLVVDGIKDNILVNSLNDSSYTELARKISDLQTGTQEQKDAYKDITRALGGGNAAALTTKIDRLAQDLSTSLETAHTTQFKANAISASKEKNGDVIFNATLTQLADTIHGPLGALANTTELLTQINSNTQAASALETLKQEIRELTTAGDQAAQQAKVNIALEKLVTESVNGGVLAYNVGVGGARDAAAVRGNVVGHGDYADAVHDRRADHTANATAINRAANLAAAKAEYTAFAPIPAATGVAGYRAEADITKESWNTAKASANYDTTGVAARIDDAFVTQLAEAEKFADLLKTQIGDQNLREAVAVSAQAHYVEHGDFSKAFDNAIKTCVEGFKMNLHSRRENIDIKRGNLEKSAQGANIFSSVDSLEPTVHSNKDLVAELKRT